MISSYNGMRWLKCDLHMHTPADARHWCGKPFEIGQEADVAKAFAESCHQTGLDVVGITDHNFLSKNFMPCLQDAFDNIEREYQHRITLFPGFEFEADVGKGMHVLCLFEPGTDPEEIDHILTECGVGRPRMENGVLAKSTKRLPEILDVVQRRNPGGTWRGIVIVPHIFEDSLFDNDRINDWLQQEEYCNPDLLAVEVPKPVSFMSKNFQKLFRSGEDCDPGWKRIRPIATLMSSDSKMLSNNGTYLKPEPNSIGYRYSWIKMSAPSIESLRQAFLDHESRIVLPEDVLGDIYPGRRNRHAYIRSISINKAAFLADQKVYFSPNMNCVIGGRGSGKSTLLEYLRLLFGKDSQGGIDDETRDRIERAKSTLTPETIIKVCWVPEEGAEDTIVWQGNELTVQGRALVDPETFFRDLPLKFYSQHQLNHLTESKAEEGRLRQAQRILGLIDGFMQNELDELKKQEDRHKQKLQEVFSFLRRAESLEKEVKRLQQEYQELDLQWRARSEIQVEARRHQQLKGEARYLDGLSGEPGRQFSDVVAMAETIAASHVPFQMTDSCHAEWFKQFDNKVKGAKDSLVCTIREAVKRFEMTIEELKNKDSKWPTIQEELKQADSKFHEACAAKGLTPDDVGRLQEIDQARTKKQQEIDKIKADICRNRAAAGNVDQGIQQLYKIWKEQFEIRKEAVRRANELAVLDGNKPFISVSVAYQEDYQSFSDLWKYFAPSDGRTRLGRMWESCGKALYALYKEQGEKASPWQVLLDHLRAGKNLTSPEIEISSQDLLHYIHENIDRWLVLFCSRVQDAADITLFRPDGSKAGSIADGTLSDGQRNTAALALLLAQEGGPLVIDQPEDELDSNFVFQDLIPMLRKVKAKRQLILATHNANIPVNGDAELVYAFEARDSNGRPLVCGGLDQASVTKAVLDIMEGSAEAFRRRREKYHF